MSTLPAGTWPSPINARSLVAGSVSIGEVIPEGDDVWWAESRPDDGGRVTLVRWRGGVATDVTPPGSNVRTRVHEYGGGAWWVDRAAAYYVDDDDQRLRRIEPGGEPTLLTPASDVHRGLRYADGRVTPDGSWFVCVHERHHERRGEGEPVNQIVAVATDGSMRMETFASGADFYAAPRISPDGSHIVWVQWMHPNMPWDATELWIAELAGGVVCGARKLVGNGDEALQEPGWWPDGTLVVVSDREEWWNLYRVDPLTGDLSAEATGAFEIVEPHWVFGGSSHAEGAWVMRDRHVDRLSLPIEVPYTSIGSLRRSGDVFTFVASSYTMNSEVVRVRGATVEVLRRGTGLGLRPELFPAPELITFPTTDDDVAHGVYYAPANPEHSLPEGERPPLIVFVHGGPTGCAQRRLVPGRAHRFWTSRGIAVVDVDYRGSTRYGRTYRRKLLGNWCVTDVDDAVAAATYLAARGDVDGQRLLIEGGSAGGTLVLLALANHDVFAAGVDLFGVTDLTALLSDDHKFESRYTYGLIGPWPDAADRYAERSPINHVDDLSSPLLVLQGSDDPVVPAVHSERIVDAVRAKGLPVAYVVFEREGHGFRKAESLVRWFEADLAFFGRVLGFQPADDIPSLDIDNLSP